MFTLRKSICININRTSLGLGLYIIYVGYNDITTLTIGGYNMKKLNRLPKRYTFDKKGYTTGDDQRWTYEYTWEDFDAFIRVHREKAWVLPGHFSICIPIPEYPILKYFQEHPEKLLESKIVQEESISLDEIKRRIDSLFEVLPALRFGGSCKFEPHIPGERLKPMFEFSHPWIGRKRLTIPCVIQ